VPRTLEIFAQSAHQNGAFLMANFGRTPRRYHQTVLAYAAIGGNILSLEPQGRQNSTGTAYWPEWTIVQTRCADLTIGKSITLMQYLLPDICQRKS
jgi:hypothetical protein